MKKTKLTRSLLAACSIVALSAVMYGCTGDGSKNDLIATEDALEQEKMAHAATQAALDTATSNAADLQMQLDTATGNAADLQMQLDTATADLGAANGDVTRLTSELETANGDVTRLTSELETAEGERDMYKGMLTTLNAKIAEDEMKMARENRIKDSTSLSAAISVANHDADAMAAAPYAALDTDPRSMLDATGITAKRSAAGMVTVTVPGASPNFTGDAGTATADSDWTEVFLSRETTGTNAGTEDMAVYTDIGAPTTWPIAADFVSPTMSHVQIAADSDDLSEIAVNIVPAPGSTFNYAATAKFEGTFLGIPGTFTCIGAACTVGADSDGDLTVAVDGGSIQFAPTDNKATYARQDATYTSFGWWLRKPESEAWRAEVFTTSNVGTAAASVSDVVSGDNDDMTASYAGMAAGKYTTESFTAGVKTDADAGHWTADAKLSATFGATNNSISGTIDSFDVSGTSDTAHWKVTLGGANDDGSAVITAADIEGGVTSVTFGGATHANAGMWDGEFRRAGEDNSTVPDVVTGTFGAITPGASLTGAFGANKQ